MWIFRGNTQAKQLPLLPAKDSQLPWPAAISIVPFSNSRSQCLKSELNIHYIGKNDLHVRTVSRNILYFMQQKVNLLRESLNTFQEIITLTVIGT